MTKRVLSTALSVALLAGMLMSSACGSERRETPLVRAVRKAQEAVVNIHSEKTTYSGESLFTGNNGRKVNGMGTGIIIDERGYIVTNHHVVNGVDSLRVTLRDGSTYEATVVSFDREHDLAVIRINASRSLPVMPMGTSSDIMLGETVIAVGNAFGYEHTITSGIVSALSRDVEVNEQQSYKNLIQTDASINPGNSGGPLLNLDGEVVGVNVAIRAGAQRIGFAIPIDDARKVIANLLSVEQLSHSYHGLMAHDVKSAEERKLVVDDAAPTSPAADAGFKPGDIIVKAGDVAVTDRADFERALLGRSAGESIEVVVERDSARQTLKLTLAEQSRLTVASARGEASRSAAAVEAKPASASSQAADSDDRTWNVIGLKLSPIPQNDRHLVGTRYRGGMQVLDVRSGSPAAANGIRTGDILVGLHIWETINSDNVRYVLEHPQFASFAPLKFYIIRGNETLYGHLRVASAR